MSNEVKDTKIIIHNHTEDSMSSVMRYIRALMRVGIGTMDNTYYYDRGNRTYVDVKCNEKSVAFHIWRKDAPRTT